MMHKSLMGRGAPQKPLERPQVDHLEELKGWVANQMIRWPDGEWHDGWNSACKSFQEKLDSLPKR